MIGTTLTDRAAASRPVSGLNNSEDLRTQTFFQVRRPSHALGDDDLECQPSRSSRASKAIVNTPIEPELSFFLSIVALPGIQ
jgi:hypothetical protein